LIELTQADVAARGNSTAIAALSLTDVEWDIASWLNRFVAG
jgi:hypothetical protein